MFVLLVAKLCAGLATALFTWGALQLNREMVERGKGMGGDEWEPGPILKLALPYMRIFGSGTETFFMFFRPHVKEDSDVAQMSVLHYPWQFYDFIRGKIDEFIISAGQTEFFQAKEIMGGMLLGFVVGFVWGMVLYSANPNLWYTLLVLALIGFGYPLLWLIGTAKKRMKQIRNSLSFSLDLLTLAVGAGLDFTVALQRIIDRLGQNALAYELSIMLREIQLGTARNKALARMAKRVNLIELTSAVNAIVQADEVGSELSPILKIQAETLRFKRMQMAEEMAQKAPVKMLFPVMMVVFTVFIIIFAPIFIQNVVG